MSNPVKEIAACDAGVRRCLPPKKPRKYFLFKLVSLNRIFRALGFVLCITLDREGKKGTTIHFTGRTAYDKWASQFEQKRTK